MSQINKNNWLKSICFFTFAILGIREFTLVVAQTGAKSKKESDCLPFIFKDKFTYIQRLKIKNNSNGWACFSFKRNLIPNPNSKFNVRLSNNSLTTNIEVNNNLLLFMTSSPIVYKDFKLSKFIQDPKNSYNVLSSSLDGFYSHQEFPEFFYPDDSEIPSYPTTLYIYVNFQYNLAEVSAQNNLDLVNPIKLSNTNNPQAQKILNISIIFKSKLKLSCVGNGYKKQLSSFQENTIAPYCNVQANKVNQTEYLYMFLPTEKGFTTFYLSNEDYSKFAIDDNHELSVNIEIYDSKECFTYYKFVGKSDMNDLLPISQYYEAMMKPKLDNKLISQLQKFRFPHSSFFSKQSAKDSITSLDLIFDVKCTSPFTVFLSQELNDELKQKGQKEFKEKRSKIQEEEEEEEEEEEKETQKSEEVELQLFGLNTGGVEEKVRIRKSSEVEIQQEKLIKGEEGTSDEFQTENAQKTAEKVDENDEPSPENSGIWNPIWILCLIIVIGIIIAYLVQYHL